MRWNVKNNIKKNILVTTATTTKKTNKMTRVRRQKKIAKEPTDKHDIAALKLTCQPQGTL